MNAKIRNLVASATAAVALAAFSSAASASPDAWARADAEYDVQHYAQALQIYQQLASQGDVRAAEMAGLMHAQGEKLYGDAVARNPAEAARLLSMAAQGGSPMARHLLARADAASLVRTSAR